jgi:hypothetical protein
MSVQPATEPETVRVVFYDRAGTTDRQDPALSVASQLEVCRRLVEKPQQREGMV